MMDRFIDRTVAPVLALPRLTKRVIALTLDLSLSVLTVWIAFYLRLGEWVTLSDAGWPAVVVAVLLAPPIFIVFGLYRAVFRYVGGEALLNSPGIKSLKRLDLHRHYLSDEMMKKLGQLGIDVDVSDQQETRDEDHRYVAIGE